MKLIVTFLVTFLLLSFSVVSLYAQEGVGHWDRHNCLSLSSEMSQNQRVLNAGGPDSLLRYSAALQGIKPFRATESAAKDSIWSLASSFMPARALAAEKSEKLRQDSLLQAKEEIAALQDSLRAEWAVLVQDIRQAPTDSLRDGDFIMMAKDAPSLRGRPSARVYSAAHRLWGTREARRLQGITLEMEDAGYAGRWSVEKVNKRTPSERLKTPAMGNGRVARSSGGGKRVGIHGKCGSWIQGGCSMQLGNPGNKKR